VERDGDDGHDAVDVGFGGWVGDNAGGDGEGEAAAGAAADGEEFAGVAAVAGGVLAGLGGFCVVSKVEGRYGRLRSAINADIPILARSGNLSVAREPCVRARDGSRPTRGCSGRAQQQRGRERPPHQGCR
jgi:hypothetical protein